MTTQNKNEILNAIADTLGDIQGLLQKSQGTQADGDQPLAKADDGMPLEQEAEGGGEGLPPPPPEGADQGAPEGGELEAEGAQGGEDPAAALAEQAKQLSDDELDHMLEALMAEKESRAGAAGGEAAPQEAPQGAPQGAAEGMPAEKSMKSEFANLAKSMAGIADAVGKLTAEVTTLKSQAKPTVSAKVTSKPAAANAQVMQKSTPVKKRLAKSQTMTFLEGELRKRNPIVNSTLIAEANLLRSDSELHQFQDRLELEGLTLPEGK